MIILEGTGLIKIFDDERMKILDDLYYLKSKGAKYFAINTDKLSETYVNAFDDNSKSIAKIAGNNATYIYAALYGHIPCRCGRVNVEIDSVIKIFEKAKQV